MGDSVELTTQEQGIMEFVREFRREAGRAPNYEQIAEGCGWSSKRSVGYHVERLKEKGLVQVTARGVEILDEPDELVIRVFADVPCGPRAAPPDIEEAELVSLRRMIGRDDVFFVRAAGRSMIDAHIMPGDCIAIKKTPAVEDGQKVVFSIDGERTLKVYRLIRGEGWLYPCANGVRGVKRIKLNPEAENQIVGVMVGMVRLI